MPKRYCLQCTDDQGNAVAFSEKNRRKHEGKHPELADVLNFVEGDVALALLDPDVVYESLSESSAVHVYCRKRSHDDPYDVERLTRYTKVYVLVSVMPYQVKTAYIKPESQIHERKMGAKLVRRR